ENLHLRQLRPEIVQYRLQRLLLRDLRLDALVDSIDHTDLPLRLKLLEIPAETEHVRSELLWRLLSRDIDTWLTVARSALVQILAATDGLPTASPPVQQDPRALRETSLKHVVQARDFSADPLDSNCRW